MTRKAPREPAAFIIAAEERGPKKRPARPGGGSRGKAGAKKAKDASAPRAPAAEATVRIVEEEDAFAPPALSGRTEARAPRAAAGLLRGFRWGRALLSAAAGLAMLWVGTATADLIRNLFARSAALGWTAGGLAALAAAAALILLGRELAGLLRLRRVTRWRREADAACAAGDERAMENLLSRLRALYAGREDMRWALARLREHDDAVMSAEERLTLAERELLGPLDERARRLIAAASRQVAVMTALMPVAALDVAFVALQNLRMLRRLAALYGGRPGALGGLRLGRMVVTHLALTGSLAITDNVVQHVLGRGLAGRLSARFGEGAVNGILTARIGIAALALVRPLPYRAVAAPGLTDFAKGLFSKDGERQKAGEPSGRAPAIPPDAPPP